MHRSRVNRSSVPGASALAYGVLLLVAFGMSAAAWAEDARTCLDRESAMLFTKIAVAISENAIDPAKIDDGFMARGVTTVIDACKRAEPLPTEADLKAFRGFMADWALHLDRKLGDIKRAGGAD